MDHKSWTNEILHWLIYLRNWINSNQIWGRISACGATSSIMFLNFWLVRSEYVIIHLFSNGLREGLVSEKQNFVWNHLIFHNFSINFTNQLVLMYIFLRIGSRTKFKKYKKNSDAKLAFPQFGFYFFFLEFLSS